MKNTKFILLYVILSILVFSSCEKSVDTDLSRSILGGVTSDMNDYEIIDDSEDLTPFEDSDTETLNTRATFKIDSIKKFEPIYVGSCSKYAKTIPYPYDGDMALKICGKGFGTSGKLRAIINQVYQANNGYILESWTDTLIVLNMNSIDTVLAGKNFYLKFEFSINGGLKKSKSLKCVGTYGDDPSLSYGTDKWEVRKQRNLMGLPIETTTSDVIGLNYTPQKGDIVRRANGQIGVVMDYTVKTTGKLPNVKYTRRVKIWERNRECTSKLEKKTYTLSDNGRIPVTLPNATEFIEFER